MGLLTPAGAIGNANLATTYVQEVIPPDTTGLDTTEAARRFAAGLGNTAPERTSRTVGEILRANLLTRFNLILGTLLAVILVVGPIQDALFGMVLVANAAIGILTELRAKHTLDHLAIISAPQARVVRDGRVQPMATTAVVLGDVVEVQPGDQIPTDGVVLTGDGLEIDESLLTGEADPVDRAAGEAVLAGSFVTAGTGRYRTTGVGADMFARRLSDEARQFRLFHSELRSGIDRILRLVTWAMVPAAVLLVASQMRAHESLPDALRGSVAGVGGMVPEGLVLLTSMAFATAAVRLGRHRVLVGELAAIEGLARVDTLCLDKTGTLTEPALASARVVVLGGHDPEAVTDLLGAVAAADPAPNASLRAVGAAAAAPGGDGWTVVGRVPFSSARKWSAVAFSGHGTWVLGAPEILHPTPLAEVDVEVAQGRRVLLLSRAPGGLDGDGLPESREAVAAVTLEERIRADAPATLALLQAEGLAVKVISGDDPRTVASVAQRAGVVIHGPPVDARRLPDDPEELATLIETHTVFGRVVPEQKRAMVRALQARGHVVAMTGDGVNDVLALKDADIGVAMGSGSDASRAVARLVLLDGTFAALPAVLAEGRRVIANIERVANLFVTKTVYALLLALAVGVGRLPFPFYPRHLTVVSALTIGIPAFFLALAPNPARAQAGFLGRVLRFAAPAGTVAAAATFSAYALARIEPGVTLAEARTTATVVLFLVGIEVLAILARPLNPRRIGLVWLMVAAFGAALALPGPRSFFAFNLPSLAVLATAIGIGIGADFALEVGWRLAGRWGVARREGSKDPSGVTAPAVP